MKVTVRLARPWRHTPGTHAYLYLPTLGLWTSHPFSIAWTHSDAPRSDEDLESAVARPGTSDSSTSSSSEGDFEKGAASSSYPAPSWAAKPLPPTTQDLLTRQHTHLSFVVRRRTGLTARLHDACLRAPHHRFSTPVLAEGPYGSSTGGSSLASYGTVLLFAAGIGITHQLPRARALVEAYALGSSNGGGAPAAIQKLTLVWVVQRAEHFGWVRGWLGEVLAVPRRREVLRVLLYVTRPTDARGLATLGGSGVQMYPGKPDVGGLVDVEMRQSVGAVAVSVCGVGSLADDVRRACRRWMGSVNVDFTEEAFSW